MLLVHHSNFGCMDIGYVFYLIYIQAVLQPDCEQSTYSIHNGVVGTLVSPFTTLEIKPRGLVSRIQDVEAF